MDPRELEKLVLDLAHLGELHTAIFQNLTKDNNKLHKNLVRLAEATRDVLAIHANAIADLTSRVDALERKRPTSLLPSDN